MKIFTTLCFLLVFKLSFAQSLSESIYGQWQTYILVSTQMPRGVLEGLARDSLDSGTRLVFRGCGEGGQKALEKYVQQVNQHCCASEALFSVDPLIFERYKVKTAPSFLIAKGSSVEPAEFSLIQGEMEWANALRIWRQNSTVLGVSEEANKKFNLISK